MNNSVLLLMKGIVALYLNSKLDKGRFELVPIFRKVISEGDFPKESLSVGGETDVILGLKYTLEYLLVKPEKEIIDGDELLLRVKCDTILDNGYIGIIEDVVKADMTEEIIRRRIGSILNETSYELNNLKLVKTIRSSNKDFTIATKGSDKNLLDKIDDYITNLTEVRAGYSSSAPVSDFIVGDTPLEGEADSLAEAINSAVDSIKPEGILKTHLQGINNCTGLNGFMRGWFINSAALTNQYKTGNLLDTFRGILMHNKPFMFDEKKKPLCLRITLENTLNQDLLSIYRQLKEVELGKKIKISDIDGDEASKFIREKLGSMGYEFRIEFHEPNKFSTTKLLAVLEKYEAQGYEIHFLDIDYVELFAKLDTSVREDLRTENSVETIRGHCHHRGTTVMSGHQLSSEAQDLQKTGASNFVKLVSKGGYYKNTKLLHTKFDLELFTNTEVHGEFKYLFMGRGKSRSIETVAENKLYWAYKFQEYGTIWDDTDGECQAIYNPGKLSMGNVNETSDGDDDGW